MTNMQSMFGKIGTTLRKGTDMILSSETREAVSAKLKEFAINNPKIAAFTTAQVVLTGLPLLLFITFCITAFLFSLIAALLIGVVVALLFTVFMIGVALVVVLPTIFLTTFGATFLFLCGIGGYYVLKWVNGGESPAAEGTAMGDKLNSLTGGRMKWLTDGINKKQENADGGAKESPATSGNEKGDVNGSTTGAEKPNKNSSNNTGGGARKPPKLAAAPKDSATKHTETVANGNGDAEKKASDGAADAENAAETVKDEA